jgi:3-oxoacyl-[acyl-carrier protein] reductase
LRVREVIVTGGGTGIGYAVAEAFVADGDRVTITGRREHVLREAAARLGVRAVPFDASDPAAVAAALPHLPEQVDVLVNNAGGVSPGSVDPTDLAAVAALWRADLERNLLSAVLVTTALQPRLRDRARIVNIGSIAARRGAGSYGAAKAALEAFTASLAATLGPRGVTANTVAPGVVLHTGFFVDGLAPERLERLVGETFTKRAGTPADVAAAVRFLCSPAAGHLTGQVLHVNGGAYLGR